MLAKVRHSLRMIDSFDPYLDYNSKRRDNSICSLLRLYGQATAFSHIASDLVFVEAWSNIFESVCVPFSVGFSKLSASLTSKFKSKIYCHGSLYEKLLLPLRLEFFHPFGKRQLLYYTGKLSGFFSFIFKDRRYFGKMLSFIPSTSISTGDNQAQNHLRSKDAVDLFTISVHK